jgi:hypothetical protein
MLTIDMITEKVKARFWAKVNKTDGCWGWTGASDCRGYGSIRIGGRYEPQVGAHRLSWVIHRGEISEGLFVLHRCDNPNCVRPDHLFLGTHQDNMNDMAEKKRAASGETHGSRTCPGRLPSGDSHWTHAHPESRLFGESNGIAKLTENQVREIRSKYSFRKYTTKMLALEYGVGETTIKLIRYGKAWRHVSETA